MSKLKKILSIICLAAAFLLLAACGDPASSLFPAKTVKFQAGAVEIEGTTDLTITLESGETALLDQLPELQKADFSGSACVAGMRGNAEGGFDITHSSRHHASCEQGRSDGSFAFSTVPKTGGLFDSSNVNFDSVRRNIAASLDVLCVW